MDLLFDSIEYILERSPTNDRMYSPGISSFILPNFFLLTAEYNADDGS